MDLNWPVVIIVGVAALALVIFLMRRNQKDEKEMESSMNEVDISTKEHESKDENNI